MRRWMAWTAMALGVALAGLAVTSWALVTRPFPDHDGEVVLPALDADVSVSRDGDGVPVLTAESDDDLFRAQGYVHAQDRFFQMDLNRHLARGRTAELFGPEQLETDRFLRTLGWERVAKAELASLSTETRAMLEAYAEGVNAYLDARSPGELSVAYRLLEPLDARAPRPWEPVDSLAFLKVMAWGLRSNLDAQIERAVLHQALEPEQVADLFPPYPQDGPVVAEEADPEPYPPERDEDAARRPGPVAVEELDRLARQIEQVDAAVGIGGLEGGSNGWVVAGEHTASGAPLLAGDPHLELGMPSVWYEAHLRCAETGPACPYDVAGVTFPGVPGVIIGHNEDVAWTFTNVGADVTDLYVERVPPDDPTRYEVEGEWVDAEVRTEELRAADGTVEELEVVVTRNGPVISEVYSPPMARDPEALPEADEALAPHDAAREEELDADEPTAGTGSARHALSLRWPALEPGPTVEAIPTLNAASDFADVQEAAADFVVPAQNLLYADAEGTIGYQASGWLPIRRHHDGSVPVPGWDDRYQWEGYLPAERLPTERDPERGWIISANEPPVAPDAYGFPLGVDWLPGLRAQRIEELVTGALGDYDVDDALAHQLDTHDPFAEVVRPSALAVDAEGDEAVATVQRLLERWDGRAEADSVGAAAFMATWRHLLAGILHPELPEAARPGRYERYLALVAELLERPDDPWWDDPTTDQREDRDAILRAAMARAHDELRDRLGPDPEQWRWGELHAITFREPSLGTSGIGPVEALFNRGPYETGGGFGIVNATGWKADEGYEAVTGPSVRTVVDLGDLDRTRRLHTTGQSGHPLHGDYAGLATRWATGEERRAPFSPQAREEATDARLRLRAAP